MVTGGFDGDPRAAAEGDPTLTTVKPPAACSRSELDEFQGLVLRGEGVDEKGLGQRVARAVCLAFHRTDGGRCDAVAAVKRPDDAYKKKVFGDSGSPECPESFAHELGWLYVDAPSRGRGLSLLVGGGALGFVGNVNLFATTQSDNAAMCRTLARLGFTPSGSPFPTRRPGESYLLSLFIRKGSTGGSPGAGGAGGTTPFDRALRPSPRLGPASAGSGS